MWPFLRPTSAEWILTKLRMFSPENYRKPPMDFRRCEVYTLQGFRREHVALVSVVCLSKPRSRICWNCWKARHLACVKASFADYLSLFFYHNVEVDLFVAGNMCIPCARCGGSRLHHVSCPSGYPIRTNNWIPPAKVLHFLAPAVQPVLQYPHQLVRCMLYTFANSDLIYKSSWQTLCCGPIPKFHCPEWSWCISFQHS